MMKSYKKVLLGCSTALFSVMLNAQNSLSACISADCNALGYTMPASACSGKATIKCPFDTSKAYCANPGNYICPAGNYITAMGHCEPCDEYFYSSTDNATSCEACVPQMGIINSDQTDCTCNSEYSHSCTGFYEEPFGPPCKGKYSSCQCLNGEWDGNQCVPVSDVPPVACSPGYEWDGNQCVSSNMTCIDMGYLSEYPSGEIGTGCGYNYTSCAEYNIPGIGQCWDCIENINAGFEITLKCDSGTYCCPESADGGGLGGLNCDNHGPCAPLGGL